MGEANSLGKDLPITRTHESVTTFKDFVSNNPNLAIGPNYGIEETQEPHPVNPNDFHGEHKLAEEKWRKSQHSKVPEKKDEDDKILDFWQEKLPNGTVVIIYTENINNVKVDVMVKHADGIAKVVARAAGSSLDQQCQEDMQIRGGEIPVRN